jgi:hypothetical protein
LPFRVCFSKRFFPPKMRRSVHRRTAALFANICM